MNIVFKYSTSTLFYLNSIHFAWALNFSNSTYWKLKLGLRRR
jgi:hypothetical protein